MSEQIEIGRIERVSLRALWKHEAHDFTPWLAKNIDLLNQSLPFDIDPDTIDREASAGDFSVDMVGDTITDDGKSAKVVIENQLEQTNHDHLGKLLTYLSAYQADKAIWIAAEARPEHAQAVQWLNDNAKVDAYLFQVEALKIGDSLAAPLFTQIVGPSALSKKAKARRQADSVRDGQLAAYWDILLPRVAEECQSHNVWQYESTPRSFWAIEMVPRAAHTKWLIRSNKLATYVDLHVDGPSPEGNRSYLQEFKERLPDDLSLQDRTRRGQKPAKLVRHFKGGWSSEEKEQHQMAQELAALMAELVKATMKTVPKLPPYESLIDDASA